MIAPAWRRACRTEGAAQRHELAADDAAGVAHVEAQVECDLVVAAARRVELAADWPDQLDQPPLDRHVHVFVLRLRPERAPLELATNLAEAADDARRIARRNDPLLPEHAGVRDAAGDVV
jgi:hypothetical protein